MVVLRDLQEDAVKSNISVSMKQTLIKYMLSD